MPNSYILIQRIDAMYICVCKAITDKQVEEAAKTAANIKEVYKRLGLGSECGVCVQEAIETYVNQRQQRNLNPPKSE